MLLNNNIMVILNEIIKEKNNKVYGRDIAKKYRLNQKTVANVLIRLEKQGILKYKTEGKNKYYFLNEFNPLIKVVVQIVEIEKKVNFLKKHKSIIELIRKIEENSKGIVILFGSYAKDSEDELSDIDLFVIGEAKLGDLENSYGKKINIVKSTKDKFDKENPFIKEILRNHIILKGIEEFVNLVW